MHSGVRRLDRFVQSELEFWLKLRDRLGLFGRCGASQDWELVHLIHGIYIMGSRTRLPRRGIVVSNKWDPELVEKLRELKKNIGGDGLNLGVVKGCKGQRTIDRWSYPTLDTKIP
jgi:hypothetical protein